MMENAPASGGSAPEASRRSVVDLLLASSALAWIGAVVYPILRYLTPPKDVGGASSIKLTDAQRDELKGKGFLVVRLGTDRVLVFKDAGQKLRALSAKCTHEGCTVQLVPADALIWCACHNGKFNLDGRVLSGPPPRQLAAYTVAGDLGGSVTISRSGGAA